MNNIVEVSSTAIDLLAISASIDVICNYYVHRDINRYIFIAIIYSTRTSLQFSAITITVYTYSDEAPKV